MPSRLIAVTLILAALMAPVRSFAVGLPPGFGGPPVAVPFCQLQVGSIWIVPAGSPPPPRYVSFVTAALANSFSEAGRQSLGIPPGFTIAVDIYADRPWSGALPGWLLVPIGTPLPPAAPAVAPTPPAAPPAPKPCVTVPPPAAPAPCPAPKVCPPTAPPAAPKPCPPPAPPSGLGGGGGVGVGGNTGGFGGGFLGPTARRF